MIAVAPIRENRLVFIFNNNYFEVTYMPLIFNNETLFHLYIIFCEITKINIFEIRYIIYNSKILDDVNLKFDSFIDAFERINKIEVILYNKKIPQLYYDNSIYHRFLGYYHRMLGTNNFTIDENYNNFVKIHLTLEEYEKIVFVFNITDINEEDEKISEIFSSRCCICYDYFDKNINIALLPCTHMLHKDCSIKYFTEQSTKCPYCNDDLKKELIK